MKRVPWMILASCLLVACSSPTDATPTRLDGRQVAIAAMERRVLEIMERGGVPGLSVAILQGGEVAYTRTFGIRNTATAEPANEQTVFGAASFSKTVFAYLVLLLVEEGAIDLDRPLYEYLDGPLPEHPEYSDLAGDGRWRALTARMCLSHTTGFPNWRFSMEGGRLVFLFEPGERHSYSGEGVVLLQRVVEHVTKRDLDGLAREKVFEPLGMTRTAFVYRDEWAPNRARPHNRYGQPRNFSEWRVANAAGSMMTTAGDYATLLAALMQAEGRRRQSVDELLRTQMRVRHRNMFGPGSRETSDQPATIGLGWGLGWGRFDCGKLGRAIFHTGHDAGTQNYTVLYVDRGIGVVLLANSDNFESVARELAAATIGDDCSPFDWIGYPRFDPDRDRTPPPEPVIVTVDPAILQRYVGRYVIGPGREVDVVLDDGLWWSGDAGRAPLRAIAEDTFFLDGDEFRIVFVDENGTIERAELRLGEIAIRAERVRAETTSEPDGSGSAPKVKFRIAEHDLYPESIAFDPVSQDFFLSSMAQPRILRIHLDGSYEDFLRSEVPGLASSIGMKVDAERRALWVCTGRFSLLADPGDDPPRTGVLRFDIDSGKLVQSWILEEQQESPYHIFNDVALTAKGEAFATTTLLGRLYRITPGVEAMTLIHQLDPGSNNNGIALGPDGEYLFVTVDRRIERMELATGQIVPLTVPDDAALGTDGLYYHDRSLIVVRPRFKNVARLFLEDDLRTVSRVETLVDDHPELVYPTTGVVVGDALVFVGTSFANIPRSGKPGRQHSDVLIHEVLLGTD